MKILPSKFKTDKTKTLPGKQLGELSLWFLCTREVSGDVMSKHRKKKKNFVCFIQKQSSNFCLLGPNYMRIVMPPASLLSQISNICQTYQH